MSRRLTGGETTLARDVFGESIDYGRVRVHDDKYIFFQPDNSGMTPNGEIYVAGIYSGDYASETLQMRGFFIHEMVHVWQYQNGILSAGVIGSAILEMIGTGGDYSSIYPYVLDANRDLTDYNLEQQAAIVEDYFRLTRLGLQPRRARLPYSRTCGATPSPATPTRRLYETVLRRFLQDPTYGNTRYSRTCSAPAR
jgi:hypothetical protein